MLVGSGFGVEEWCGCNEKKRTHYFDVEVAVRRDRGIQFKQWMRSNPGLPLVNSNILLAPQLQRCAA